MFLKKEETVPADILLLDTNEIKNKHCTCYVDEANVQGTTSHNIKVAATVSNITQRNSPQKFQYNEYRKILTGMIQYEAPN